MEMLSKGAIVETQLTPDSFVSQIFLVEKKDSGQKLVINLKALLLPFQWEEKYNMFTFLLFGLSAAPRVFTKLLKPVVGFLRQVGCCLIIYLDDLLILHQDRDRL